MWKPSAALMSCAVIRTRLPSLRTLPSRMVLTLSFSPTVRRSSVLPLNWNEDVRAATRSVGIFAKSLSSSSERPSEKYSCSLSELMLTKGSTAIEAVPDCAGVLPGARPPRPNQKAAAMAATSTTIAKTKTINRLLLGTAVATSDGAETDEEGEAAAAGTGPEPRGGVTVIADAPGWDAAATALELEAATGTANVPELVATTLPEVAAAVTPLCVSRLSRCRSVRMSAAFW